MKKYQTVVFAHVSSNYSVFFFILDINLLKNRNSPGGRGLLSKMHPLQR